MDFSFSDLNFSTVETLPDFETRAAFTANSVAVFVEWKVLSDITDVDGKGWMTFTVVDNSSAIDIGK